MSDLENRTNESADAADPPTGPIKAQAATGRGVEGPDESTKRPHRPFIPHMIRLFAVPIVLAWVFFTILVNFAVPKL
jgi:putative drug exporter of the RND superfamily